MLKNILGNNRGSVMNIALLMLVLLTTMVIFMSRTSITDVEIAGNEKALTSAFYAADAGAYGSAKLVGRTLKIKTTPTFNVAGSDFPAVDYIIGNFSDQVFGYISTDSDADLTQFGGAIGDEDIQFLLNGFEVNVGLQAGAVRQTVGSSAEFGAGAQGHGSKGSVSRYYFATAFAEGPKNAMAEINVEYRKISDTPGGL